MQRLRRLCSGLAAPGGVDALLTALQVQTSPRAALSITIPQAEGFSHAEHCT